SLAASSPADLRACHLVTQGSVRNLVGLAHSERKHFSESPTSPSPYDHTVGPGADESRCDTFAWNGKKPSKSELEKILVPGSSRYKVPNGRGSVVVTTYVRDPGTDGQQWDADKFYGELLTAATRVRHQVGGKFIKVPKDTADDRDALTLGAFGDVAEGIWEKG